MVLHVTNNTGQTVTYGYDEWDPDIKPAPKPKLAPGETDTLFMTSNWMGAYTRPTYIFPGFKTVLQL